MGTSNAAKAAVTLADVLARLDRNSSISGVRRRDLRSAVNRMARLQGDLPAHIQLDLATISKRLATPIPAAAGLSQKTLANLRSDFLAAVKTSGLESLPAPPRTSLSAGWRKLLAGHAASKRIQFGLSRYARYCSSAKIEPELVTGTVLDEFINFVGEHTLHRKPKELHRNVAAIWNDVAEQSRLHLQRLPVPSFRGAPKRIDWSRLHQSFRKDVGHYLEWCGGEDAFASDARPRALAPGTVALQRNHLHAALTALADSGTSLKTIRSLRDLVTIKNFQRILRRRHEMVHGRENAFNRDIARTLTEIARRWVKVDAAVLNELKRLAGKVPSPLPGLTSKNKATLRQFDDLENLRRLIEMPNQLWAEVKRARTPSFRTILKAQAALAIDILLYMPIRPQNLWALKFDEHIFLQKGVGAISSLELPASEVKNRTEMGFDIPERLAKMLIEYRDRLVPKVFGRRRDRLFIKADGTAKNQWAVSWLIRRVIRQRLGLQLSPHQFRHLGAKLALDAEPGNFETVRQLLGHKSSRTTTSSYAGISSRRAARHHRRLIEQALTMQQPSRGR